MSRARGWVWLTKASVAIDGSKFKEVNSRDNNFTKGKMERRQHHELVPTEKGMRSAAHPCAVYKRKSAGVAMQPITVSLFTLKQKKGGRWFCRPSCSRRE